MEGREFKLETNKLQIQLTQRELVLLRKKLEILEKVSDKVTVLSKVSINKKTMQAINLASHKKNSASKGSKKGKQSVDIKSTKIFNNRTHKINQFKPKMTPNMKNNIILAAKNEEKQS